MAFKSTFYLEKTKKINTVYNIFGREYDQSNQLRFSLDLIRGRYESCKNLYHKDLFAHFGCVNAIEFSDNGKWLVSGGDDRRVLLWDVEKAISGVGQATVMKGEHNSNIFCLGFDSKCSRLFSAGNDELVMIHDTQTRETLDVILHNDAIYGLSIDPCDDNVFVSACDNGHVCLWDIRGPSRDPLILARYSTAFHAVMYNPFESRLIATANAKEGIGLWDVRKPRCVLQQYNSSLLSSQSAMSVRFNKQGTLILALRRRLPPVLYNLTYSYPIAEFDNIGYYNSCTMKSCCFAGDSDQYVLSGSDDFKLYMWKIPDESLSNNNDSSIDSTIWIDNADLILKGHRSIVNQVRFNYANSMIASSGVEKVIKLWSTFPLPYGTGSLEGQTTKENRKVYSHEDYINLVLESGQFVTHDYSHQSVQEDSRMMAFFDSLVQRDIEGWTSDSSDDSCNLNFYELNWNMNSYSDDSNDSDSSENNSENEDLKQNHIISYLNVLTKRIQGNNIQNGNNEKIVNNKSPGTSSVNNDKLISKNESPNESTNDFNRITKLITIKKRDQLKKIAKNTVRAAKKHLKKKSVKTSAIQNEKKKCEGLDTIKKQLESISQQIDCDSENKSDKSATKKIHRRLRFLTNQSDLVFNEVLPSISSSSDSDSNDELYNSLISGSVDRMHRLRNEFDFDELSLNSSSDSGYENLLGNIQPQETLSSSSEEDQCENKQIAEQSKKEEDNQNVTVTNTVKLSHVTDLEKADNEEENDFNDVNDVNEVNESKKQVIHCPYKHNLCNPLPSTSSYANDSIKKSITFKPITQNTQNRSYRKRKSSDSNENNTKKENNEDSNKKEKIN